MTSNQRLSFQQVQYAPWCIALLAVGMGVVLGTLWFLVWPAINHYGFSPSTCMAVNGMQWAFVGLMIEALVLGAVLAFLYRLKVTVTDTLVTASFGVGLYQKIIPLAHVQSVMPVTNQWWWGWGIKCFKRDGRFGWLYNVSGLRAVELTLADGKLIRIGTDDPEALARAISERLP